MSTSSSRRSGKKQKRSRRVVQAEDEEEPIAMTQPSSPKRSRTRTVTVEDDAVSVAETVAVVDGAGAGAGAGAGSVDGDEVPLAKADDSMMRMYSTVPADMDADEAAAFKEIGVFNWDAVQPKAMKKQTVQGANGFEVFPWMPEVLDQRGNVFFGVDMKRDDDGNVITTGFGRASYKKTITEEQFQWWLKWREGLVDWLTSDKNWPILMKENPAFTGPMAEDFATVEQRKAWVLEPKRLRGPIKVAKKKLQRTVDRCAKNPYSILYKVSRSPKFPTVIQTATWNGETHMTRDPATNGLVPRPGSYQNIVKRADTMETWQLNIIVNDDNIDVMLVTRLVVAYQPPPRVRPNLMKLGLTRAGTIESEPRDVAVLAIAAKEAETRGDGGGGSGGGGGSSGGGQFDDGFGTVDEVLGSAL